MSSTIEQRECGREKTRRWRAALSEEQRAAVRTQDRIAALARYHSLAVDGKAERLRKRAERRLAQRRAAGVTEETIALWAENAAKRRVTKTLGPPERLAQQKERQREASLRWRTKRAARYRAADAACSARTGPAER